MVSDSVTPPRSDQGLADAKIYRNPVESQRVILPEQLNEVLTPEVEPGSAGLVVERAGHNPPACISNPVQCFLYLPISQQLSHVLPQVQHVIMDSPAPGEW